jgi:NADPH:quinone reductase-like Zn-dependent oxidoreductase
MGLPLKFPFVPASDMAGTVVQAGEDVKRFKVGDRVISTFRPGWIDGLSSGTARVPPYETLGGVFPGVLAGYVAFPEDWFSPAPETLDDAEPSTLPCAGLTAWFALVERGGVRPGQTVVVQGTGGVALFALQIARAQGAEVIVVSGSSPAPRSLAPHTSSIVRRKIGWKPCTASLAIVVQIILSK